jgi:hypothetical protein
MWQIHTMAATNRLKKAGSRRIAKSWRALSTPVRKITSNCHDFVTKMQMHAFVKVDRKVDRSVFPQVELSFLRLTALEAHRI